MLTKRDRKRRLKLAKLSAKQQEERQDELQDEFDRLELGEKPLFGGFSQKRASFFGRVWGRFDIDVERFSGTFWDKPSYPVPIDADCRIFSRRKAPWTRAPRRWANESPPARFPFELRLGRAQEAFER